MKPATSTGCNIAKNSVEFYSRRLRERDAIGPKSTQKQIKHTVDYYSDFNKLPTYRTPCNITRSQLTHAFLVLTLKIVASEFFKIYSLQCVHLIGHCTTPPANAFPDSRADWIWNYLMRDLKFDITYENLVRTSCRLSLHQRRNGV